MLLKLKVYNHPKKDIDVNLTVSTSVAGSSLKIPLKYSQSNYVPLAIDKVWLASVYTGMVMGGPVGALIGSALSEKANTAITGIKDSVGKGLDKSNLLDK